MMHPCTTQAFVNDVKGLGVFATHHIPKGTIVFVVDSLDIKIPLDHPLMALPHYSQMIMKYGYHTQEDGYVIGWDHSKFVNHSCDPNTISTGWGFEIALRDIEKGEEITDEYGLFNIEQDFACSCGTSLCRGKVRQSDYKNWTHHWDEQTKDALLSLSSVSQPLWPFLDPEIVDLIKTYLEHPQDSLYRSVLSNIAHHPLYPV